MEARIKEALKTTKLRATGRGGSGCINEGEAFETDDGEVFIKRNSKSQVSCACCLERSMEPSGDA